MGSSCSTCGVSRWSWRRSGSISTDAPAPVLLVDERLREAAPEQAWSGLPARAVTTTGGAFERIAAGLAEHTTVIALGCERAPLLAASAHRGVIPVLLDAKASGNPLDDPRLVQLPDALALAPLLREPGGAELLALVRRDAAAERATATARIEAVLEDARAAGGLSIYGSGTIGRQALAAARLADRQVRAFLDSNPQRSGTVVDGVEVRGVDDVVPGRSVIVPAIGRAVQAVTRTAHERGALHVLSLSELYFSCRPPAEPEPDYADDLGANWLRYLSLFTRLADARSRAVLAALVRHRRSLDPAPLAEVCERDHPQWFAPELLPRPSGEVFVDGGAFDGDTVRSYVAACGDAYRAIHAFELDPEVAARGRERTADLRAVHFHAVGLSNRSGGAAFRRTGTSSTVAAAPGEGDANAELGRLDDLVPEPISFLKLDVEGEEANALAGAERHLRDEQPVLAIASYHKAHDLWDLPRRVLSSSSAYRLHLRHYTELAYETVLYADAASARS